MKMFSSTRDTGRVWSYYRVIEHNFGRLDKS